MKKIILPLVLVVFLAGAGFLISKNKSQTAEIGISPAGEAIQEGQQNKENFFKGSLKGLLGLGKSVKCTWSAVDEDATIEGVVYVSGQQTRTETKIQAPETNMTMYFLTDGESAYSWGNDQAQGYKFNMADFEDETSVEELEDDDQAEANEYQEAWSNEYEYQCENWKADNAVFAVPTNITFTDMGEQMQQMQEQAEEMKQGAASLCNSLPESQRAECLESLE